MSVRGLLPVRIRTQAMRAFAEFQVPPAGAFLLVDDTSILEMLTSERGVDITLVQNERPAFLDQLAAY